MVASEAIGRFLERRTKNEIHGGTNQLLCLARHFEQSGGRDRHGLIKRHQEVHITAGTGLATRRRAKNLQPADVVFFAKGTQPSPQVIRELCLRNSPHSGRIARPHVNFKTYPCR